MSKHKFRNPLPELWRRAVSLSPCRRASSSKWNVADNWYGCWLAQLPQYVSTSLLCVLIELTLSLTRRRLTNYRTYFTRSSIFTEAKKCEDYPSQMSARIQWQMSLSAPNWVEGSTFSRLFICQPQPQNSPRNGCLWCTLFELIR